jgi:hypothetical protein
MNAETTPLRRVSSDMHALLERLYLDRERLFGTRQVQLVPVTFDSRESSEVARTRVTTSFGSNYVFAKLVKPRPGEAGLGQTRVRFRRDYDVTRHVFEAMKRSRDLRCVEPIVCYDDLLGVVTNEVTGLPLNGVIAKNAAWPTSASRVGALELALSRLGRWMATFQQVAPAPEPLPLSLDAVRQYIDTRLRALTNLPRAAFSESDRRDVLAYFERRAAEVPSRDLVEVPVHGDIVPSNVIVRDDAVTVLDFGMYSRGSKYLDVARLYTQLHFYTAKPQYRPRLIGTLQQAVLAAFEPGLRADNPLFEICAVQHVVCHLLSHARQPGPFPVNVYSSHQRRRHRQWLRERIQRSVAKPGVATRSDRLR